MEMTTTATRKTSADILGNIVGKLELEKTRKRDMIIPARELLYRAEDHSFTQLNGQTLQPVVDAKGNILTELCHSQVAEKLLIPASYYNRMKTAHPELLAANVNGWFFIL